MAIKFLQKSIELIENIEIIRKIKISEGGGKKRTFLNFSDMGNNSQNIRIYEVGIKYFGRKYSEGKKITWKDGFSAIRCIIQYNLLK